VARGAGGRGGRAGGGAGGGGAPPGGGDGAGKRGNYTGGGRERRVFLFGPPGGAGAPRPHFLNLNSHSSVPRPVAEEWQFDPAALQACLAQPAEWKRRYGFPAEVSAILGAEAAPAWERVLVDRPERLGAGVIAGGGAGGGR